MTRFSFSTSRPKCLNMMRIWFLRPSNQPYLVPGILGPAHQFQPGRRRAPAAQRNAVAELLLLFRRQRPVHFHQVGLGDVVGGRRDGVGEFAVVGEQQQALAVVIQPAHRVDPLLDARAADP